MAWLVALAVKSLVVAGGTLLLLRLMSNRSASDRSWIAHLGLAAMLLLPVAAYLSYPPIWDLWKYELGTHAAGEDFGRDPAWTYLTGLPVYRGADWQCRQQVKGNGQMFHQAFSLTPASPNVAISSRILQEASTRDMASAAPVPSPRRMCMSSSGCTPSQSIIRR